jgi:hypothetical protein
VRSLVKVSNLSMPPGTIAHVGRDDLEVLGTAEQLIQKASTAQGIHKARTTVTCGGVRFDLSSFLPPEDALTVNVKEFEAKLDAELPRLNDKLTQALIDVAASSVRLLTRTPVLL